jgi:hypothetical protein
VLAAKAAVFAAVASVTGIASSFAAFFTGRAILSRNGNGAHISDPQRSVLSRPGFVGGYDALASGMIIG